MNDKEREQENLNSSEPGDTDATVVEQPPENRQSADNPSEAATETETTEVNETPAPQDESEAQAAASEQPSEADTTEPPAPKKGRSWVGVLAFLLAICALIVAGYGFQKIQQLELQAASLKSTTDALGNDLQAKLQQSLAAADQAGDKAAAADAQLKALRGDIAAQKQNVDELQDRLTRSMKQISKFSTDKRKDWLLAEVEYLLRLANQRVLMEKSPVGALALLQSSDRILKETDDVSIYNVRKAVAKDIAALQAVPRVDIDGIFLKLAALNDQVSQLHLTPISEKRKMPDMLEKVTPEAVSETWNQGLKTSWNQAMDKLEKLVIIQHRDEPIEPLLSPEQVYFLQQNLHLMIEQAQLSLLQGHQSSYDTSLNKATSWINQYFDTDDATTQALVKGLESLKSVQVSPALPDISSSLKALKAYMADVHNGDQGAA